MNLTIWSAQISHCEKCKLCTVAVREFLASFQAGGPNITVAKNDNMPKIVLAFRLLRCFIHQFKVEDDVDDVLEGLAGAPTVFIALAAF